jgi:signal transduction histidine kinase
VQFPKSISLYLPFGFILFSVIILQYFSYRNILHLKENNQASATYLKQNNILGKIKTDMIDADNIKTRIVYQDEQNIHKQFQSLLQSVTKNISLLQKNNSDTSFSKQIDTLNNLTVHYTLNESNVIRLYLSGQTEKAALLDSLSENDSYFDKIEDESDVLIDKYSRKAISLNETGYSKIQRLTFFSWLLTASLFLLIIYRTYHIIQEHEKDKLLHNHLKIAEADARKSSIVKDQFLANISHEIRTPMNAIIGFTKRLQKTKLTKEQAQYVHAVNVSGENLLAIINDILDFSKIEAGMYHIHEVVFNLPALLHDLQDLYALKVHEKNIAFTLTMDENIPTELLGDDVRLMQTFSNIVSNAIKFTDKGSIEIHANIKEETEQILTIDIKIKDTGIGIPAEKINLIFERFQQASFDTNRQYGGTGLGLAIVKHIANRHQAN